MTAFRIFLVILFVNIVAYTMVVGMDHGWNLFPPFFGELTAMTWSGQFNLDFASYLLLSALWVAWRNDFAPAGIALGLLASVAGILFLSIYLLWISVAAKGDMRVILLGQARARR